MRILAACSLGGAGHLQPLVPLLDAARAQGHETRVVAPPALGGMVTETGHVFEAGGEPPEAVIAPIREQLPVTPAAEASVLANRELFGRLATAAMLPGIRRVVRSWQPDLIIRDPCEYASAIVADEHHIAVWQVAIGLADGEWRSIEVAAPAIEADRPGIVEALRHSPYVTRLPASLDPSPFPDTRRFAERVPTEVRSLPAWWGGSEAPLVYVSFGTVLGHMSTAAEVYGTALGAVAGINARVLLTVGRHFDLGALGDLPDHVHVEPWVDQADVLAEASLVVCHGGSGTTFGALAAGIPVVLVPLFADQFANSQVVADAGAGVLVETGQGGGGRRLPLGPNVEHRIADAIAAVMARSSERERARRIAHELSAAPTAGALIDGER